MPGSKWWTKDEDEVFERLAPTHTAHEIQAIAFPHRTVEAIQSRARHTLCIRIKRSQPRPEKIRGWWPPEDEAAIRATWPDRHAAQAALPHRTWSALKHKACELGIVCTRAPEWKTTEIRALRQAYATGGIKEAIEALPGRSLDAIWSKAWQLGIRVSKRAPYPPTQRRRRRPKATPRNFWTPEEIKLLRGLWTAGAPLETVQQHLKRTRGSIRKKLEVEKIRRQRWWMREAA